MIQIGDRIVFVRTLDGQPLVGTIHGKDWQDDPNTGSFKLHWPMVYVEQQGQAKDGQVQTRYAFMPPSLLFPTPSLDVHWSQRRILSDAAVKAIGEVYERAKKEEQARETGLVLPNIAPPPGALRAANDGRGG